MGQWFMRVLLMSLRFFWFVFGVLPGRVLLLVHSRFLAARGTPQSALLPLTFYRIVGFVLTTVCLSVINRIVGSGTG